MSHNSYSSVTEVPGQGATQYQLSMMLTRYDLAYREANNKKVLEIACGAGMGLGMLSSKAISVIGGDIDPNLVDIAQTIYQDNKKVKVLEIDAHNLPFSDASFDLVLMFEAIYYLQDIKKFLQEVNRVLTPNGKLIISTVNCQWHGFNPSPFSVKYYSCDELTSLLKNEGFDVEVQKGFYDQPGGMASNIISVVRKIAVALHLIPNTMEGKERLKRLFYGKLTPIPAQITHETAKIEPITMVSDSDDLTLWKKLYFIAKK
jgi:SAM-dependent methyltransferase